MRLLKYAAVVASAACPGWSIASPVPDMRESKLELERRTTEQHRKLSLEEKDAKKYFHEPGKGYLLVHYDARYFHGVVSDEERTETQLHMMRAYLDFFRENGLDTWIAHGTLLGWWWNGKRLPWDWDMDTQVSEATLHHLGEKYNQTRHTYGLEAGTHREYLLDVNPLIVERGRGDGMNIIDARWVDTSNGLFIDITGLSETHPDRAPGTWSCKNYHRYRTSDLYPMRETIFEGAVAKVPYSYDRILIDEYKEKALVTTEFQGYAWDQQQKLWVKTTEQIEKERLEAEQRKKDEEERTNREKEEGKAENHRKEEGQRKEKYHAL